MSSLASATKSQPASTSVEPNKEENKGSPSLETPRLSTSGKLEIQTSIHEAILDPEKSIEAQNFLSSSPENIFIEPNQYKTLPFARELFILAAKKNTSQAKIGLETHADLPFKDDVLKEVLRTCRPDDILLLDPSFLPEATREEFLKQSANVAYPSTVIYSRNKLEGYSWGEAIISKKISEQLNSGPDTLLDREATLRDRLDHKELVANALQNALKTCPDKALIPIIKILNDENYPHDKAPFRAALEQCAAAAVKTSPHSVVLYSENLKNYPWAPERIIDAHINLAEKTPSTFFSSCRRSPDWPSENKPLYTLFAASSAAKTQPGLLVQYFDVIKDYPWAEPLIVAAAEELPEAERKKIFGITTLSNPPTDEQRSAILSSCYLAEHVMQNELTPLYGEFQNDPAYKIALEIGGAWIDKSVTNPAEQAQFRTMVARRLIETKQQPTEQNIEATYSEIKESREKYSHIPLFSGRNVVLAAHNEVWDSNDPSSERFGKKELRETLAQEGKSISFMRAEQNASSLAETKNSIIEAIKTTPPPMTFMFDGHGLSNKLCLAPTGESTSEESNANHITAFELANALKERHDNFPELKNASPGAKDILIFSSCTSLDFTKNLSGYLLQSETTPPICVSEAEYGQYGYSYRNSKLGADFIEKTLGLGNIPNQKISQRLEQSLRGLNIDTSSGIWAILKPPTIETIMEQEFQIKNSNPSLFVPDANGRLMQISKSETYLDALQLPRLTTAS